MNDQDKKQLEAILSKDINDLTENDKAILNARRFYLTKEQTGRYPFLKKNNDEGEDTALPPTDARLGESFVEEPPKQETAAPVTTDGADHSADPDWKPPVA